MTSWENNALYEQLAGKTALVTGGAGFIGSHLVRKLAHLKCRVIALVRPSSDLSRISDIADKIQLVECDLSTASANELEKKLTNLQLVYHLAASGVNQTQRDVLAIVRTNVMGTLALLQAATALHVERFVYCGSCFEYGSGDNLSEDLVPNPASEYSASKSASGLFVSTFLNRYNLPAVTLRLFTVYGPFEAEYRLIPSTILKALDGEDIELTSGEQTRDFVYIEDAVNAILAASIVDAGIGEILNICSGTATTVKSMVNMIVGSIETTTRPVFGAIAHRDTELWSLSGDPNKTKDILGWQSRVTNEEGIEETVQWFKNNRERYRGL